MLKKKKLIHRLLLILEREEEKICTSAVRDYNFKDNEEYAQTVKNALNENYIFAKGQNNIKLTTKGLHEIKKLTKAEKKEITIDLKLIKIMYCTSCGQHLSEFTLQKNEESKKELETEQNEEFIKDGSCPECAGKIRVISPIDVKDNECDWWGSLELIKQIDVRQGPHGIRASEDGSKVYVGVTTTNEILIIDSKTLDIIDTVQTGNTPFWLSIPGNQ